MVSLGESIENYFKNVEEDYYTVLSFKRNIEYFEDDPLVEEAGISEATEIKNYLDFTKADIVCSTVGIHLNGEKKVPHIHYHCIIVTSSVPKTFLTNPSKHRKASGFKLEGISMRQQLLDQKKPKWHTISYPLKEGRSLTTYLNTYDRKPMSADMLSFLLAYGKDIYETELAKHLSRDMSDERKQNEYLNLLNFVRTNAPILNGFYSLQVYMEEEYLGKLAPEKMVCISNYKKNLQRVAVALKICKSYEL